MFGFSECTTFDLIKYMATSCRVLVIVLSINHKSTPNHDDEGLSLDVVPVAFSINRSFGFFNFSQEDPSHIFITVLVYNNDKRYMYSEGIVFCQ